MEGSDFLLAGVLFLFAAVAAVPLASRLGIGAVLGYLLAGIAIGPGCRKRLYRLKSAKKRISLMRQSLFMKFTGVPGVATPTTISG